ncbi:hypothetical protein KDK95_34900, partial [Actinospica sp. MGRD01-02]
MPEIEPEETTLLLPVARAAGPGTAPIPAVEDADGRPRVVRGRRLVLGTGLAAAASAVIWMVLSASS